MKFSAPRETILKPLQTVVGVVERRQTMPILSNVLLSVQGNKLSVSATDLEVEMVAEAEVETEASGDITVPGRKLHDIFRALPRELMATEWRVSRAILEALLGEPCIAGSVPGGDISRLVLESAGDAGLRYLFTSEPLVRPARVGDTWVLGRVILKAGVSAGTIRQLVAFHGWQRAQLIRRLGGIARALFPPLYAQYVRLRTRERHS